MPVPHFASSSVHNLGIFAMLLAVQRRGYFKQFFEFRWCLAVWVGGDANNTDSNPRIIDSIRARVTSPSGISYKKSRNDVLPHLFPRCVFVPELDFGEACNTGGVSGHLWQHGSGNQFRAVEIRVGYFMGTYSARSVQLRSVSVSVPTIKRIWV